MTNLIKSEQITSEEREVIYETTKEYCNAKNLSQNDLAAKSGISGATINKVLNRKWDDISNIMWRKLWNVVSNGKNSMLIHTRDHEVMKQALKICREKKFMIGITGDTGTGKTTSLKLLNRQRNTYYVTYEKSMKAKQFFAAILKELGVLFEGNIHEMVSRIAEELNVKPNPVLIIDEAGKITHLSMLYLHVLRDKTIDNCGILLAGMPYFKSNLEKNSSKQKEGYAEFKRRVNIWHELKGLRREEVKFICNANGIKDEEDVKGFYQYKRFGDLMNSIILYQIDNIISSLNE
jgi:DNA transposition AAA+ family ATPase